MVRNFKASGSSTVPMVVLSLALPYEQSFSTFTIRLFRFLGASAFLFAGALKMARQENINKTRKRFLVCRITRRATNPEVHRSAIVTSY